VFTDNSGIAISVSGVANSKWQLCNNDVTAYVTAFRRTLVDLSDIIHFFQIYSVAF
jgi:hypothetical protein